MRKYLITEKQYNKYLQNRKKQLISEDLDSDYPFIYKLLLFMRGAITEQELIEDEDLIDKIDDGNLIFSYNGGSNFFEANSMKEYDANLLEILFNGYWNYDPDYDYYNMDEEFAYITENIFNLENDEKYHEILKKIGFEPKDYNTATKNFKTFFPDEMESIYSDYLYELNHIKNKNAKEYIYTELKDDLQKYGINVIYPFYKFSIPLNVLYDKSMDNIDFGNFNDLLKTILKDLNYDDFDFWDAYHEGEYQNFQNDDFEDFNKSTAHILDKIIDKIDNGLFDDFLKIKERLPKQFKFDEWYVLPKDKNIMFRIDRVNYDNLKIEYSVKYGGNSGNIDQANTYRFSKTITDFLNFLYQPELF